MSGWVAMILFALAVAAGLYPFVRRDKGALQFLAAALLLALAGYSWQGKPSTPGSPKSGAAPAAELPEDDFAILRPELLGRFDRASYWMTLADADRRRGNPHGAAEVLQSAVRQNPRSYSLWLAYGYNLVAASDNLMSRASQLAFERAGQLAPGHPAPRFFYGLALARGGNYEAANSVWTELLPAVAPDSPYHAVITERLAAIRQAWSTGAPLRPAPPPLPQPRSTPTTPQPVTVVE
jgi:cytochrome c-type biogenesis protein CcmH